MLRPHWLGSTDLLPWRDRYRQLVTAMLIYICIGLVASLAAISDRQASIVSSLGRASLAAGSSFLISALIGAIFATANEFGREGAVVNRRTWAHTTAQLRSVTDWAVKMLIGALLALQTFAPTVLWEFARVFAIAGAGVDGVRIGGLVALYFGSGGFVLGYFVARRRALELERSPLLEDGLRLAWRLPASGGHWKGLTVEQNQAIEAVARAPTNVLRTDDELRSWARVQLMFGDVNKAYEALVQLALRKDDKDLQAELEYARSRVDPKKAPHALRPPVEPPPLEPGVTLDTPSNSGEPTMLSEAAAVPSTAPPILPSEAASRMYEALYEPEPGGFQKAIAVGERFADKVQSAPLLVYLACAYGQEHAWLKKNAPDPAREEEVANRALFCVQQAIDLDPTWRASLRSFWSPNSPGEDNDLVSLHDDARFAALLDPDGLTRAMSTATQNCSFDGTIAIWMTLKDGAELPRDTAQTYEVAPGVELRLVAQFNPDPLLPGAQTADIHLDGVTRTKVDFTLRPDSPDVDCFAPTSLMVEAPIGVPSIKPDFLFDAPSESGEYELWVYVTQAGRTAQLVRLSMTVG